MSKAYNSELQAKVEQFLKEKGISQAKAGRPPHGGRWLK